MTRGFEKQKFPSGGSTAGIVVSITGRRLHFACLGDCQASAARALTWLAPPPCSLSPISCRRLVKTLPPPCPQAVVLRYDAGAWRCLLVTPALFFAHAGSTPLQIYMENRYVQLDNEVLQDPRLAVELGQARKSHLSGPPRAPGKCAHHRSKVSSLLPPRLRTWRMGTLSSLAATGFSTISRTEWAPTARRS